MSTLQQVAERAGVALSTVSFVMNNSPRVSVETRRAVMKAAQELNYTLGKKGRPRRAEGSARQTRRRKTVGFLYPYSESSLRTNITYLCMLQGAETAARTAGQNLVVKAIDATRFSSANLRLDGAIAIMNDPIDRFLPLSQQIPLVRVMGVPSPSLHWDQVTYNNQAIGPMAARYLLERGHKLCAYFSPFVDHPRPQEIPFVSQNADRQRLFVEAIQNAGASVRINARGLPTDLGDHPPVLMSEIFKELLLTSPRPTALFVPADHFIQSVYGTLYSIGVRPGTDIDVISCNNDMPLLQGLHPRPAVVDLHLPSIGMAGIEQLIRRIESPDRPYGITAFEPSLVTADAAFAIVK